jgi:hypothetical protein
VVEEEDASPVPELSDTFADMLTSLTVKIRDIEDRSK